ncbi:MAG: putative O-glycosylation ligase, exosortase A system-associated, partial [Alphaproteobacteria bacterium]
MRSLLVLLIIFSFVPAILAKPHVGVLLWSWISYMNPHRLTWGTAANFPVADVVGGGTILA